MLPDWKEPEKLADNVVVDAESNDETRFEAAITSGVPQDAEVPGLQPGTILAERFEILSLLGSGGMSKVFKAKDLLSDKMLGGKFNRIEFGKARQISPRIRRFECCD